MQQFQQKANEMFSIATGVLQEASSEIAKCLQYIETKKEFVSGSFTQMFQEMETVLRKQEEEAFKANNMVSLNVGGTVFSTSKQTLMAEESSFFHSMVHSGCWKPDQETGQYFIDRDPRFVQEILDYLRKGERTGQLNLDLKSMTTAEQQLLHEQLDFFQVDSLLKPLKPVALSSGPVQFVRFAPWKALPGSTHKQQDEMMDAAARIHGGTRAASHEDYLKRRIVGLPKVFEGGEASSCLFTKEGDAAQYREAVTNRQPLIGGYTVGITDLATVKKLMCVVVKEPGAE
eukprot:TRINITY_DN49889_c0_g1_i1.p1 TRINITY_DN49889_c0_g1~~TRINITY_DN49889_c0_g1_i1.p1  ORF type:complete len:288 (-),score=39.84 TRINITY_DN49889_c0_g1_i1:65-928(-)